MQEDVKDMDVRFGKAMETAGSEFLDMANYYVQAWMPARGLVKKALDEREKVDASGQIVVFNSGCPWKEHLFQLEKEAGLAKPLLYVLYPDNANKWRIQCVPARPDSFECRKALPERWCGVRDDALSELTGVPGCIFVHANGFIGGAQTYESALKLAQMSIAM